MDIIVSGLIIISILSTPIDKISNSLIQSGILSLKRTKSITQENNNEIKTEDISNMLFEIDENFSTINSLKKQKFQEQANLDNKMNSLIENNQKLTESQMEFFQNSSKLIAENESSINYYNEKLKNKKEMILLQNDILSKSNNLHIIYKKLSLILDYQVNIITNLYKAIFNLKCCAEIF